MRYSRSVIVLLALALVGGVTPLLAQRRNPVRERTLSCSERGRYRDDGERSCNLLEKTIAFPSGVLTVDSRTNGEITIVGENRRDVQVRARIEGHARSQARADRLVEDVEIRTDNGRISAGGPDTGRNEWWSVSFEVHVPSSANLDLTAHNGGIAIAGVTGDLRMETENGGIHLEAVNGNVVAETTNGGVVVNLDGDRWQGRGLDVTTTNGGVTVTVPDGYSAHLETGTTNGGIDIDFPVTVQGRIGRRITTDLGRGGPTIRLITTNGGVRVRRQ